METDGSTETKKVDTNEEGVQDESLVTVSTSSSEVTGENEAAEAVHTITTPQLETSYLRSETVFRNANPVPSNVYEDRPPIPSVGNRDLNPFPGIDPYPQVHPSMGTNDPFRRGPTMPGNEIGPSHPIFDPNNSIFEGDRHQQSRFDPFGSMEGNNRFLQPRFDPFGPIGGPNGPDFGNPGGVGFGRGRGFGSGRGRGPTRFPGEPNPDHLRPPGYDSDFI